MDVRTTLLQFLLVIVGPKIKDVLSEEVCGHPHGMLGGKIVGGYAIGYYKYPWFVSLTQEDSPICGATLISKKAVVTAAHCFDQHTDSSSELANLYVLKIGAYNICNKSESTQQSFHVEKVHVHERYKKEDPFFDIALLMLKEPAEGFEPACLPTKALDSKTRPREGVVTGFGVLKYQGIETSCVQREARVLIHPDEVCKEMISKVDQDIKNFQHAFCAGYLEGGVDACQGDSGGPLMVLHTESRIQLLGITSFGYKCAMKDLLGIYTDVSHFLDWIKEKSNPNTPEVTSTSAAETSSEVTEATEASEGSTPTTATTTEKNDSDDSDESENKSGEESDSDEGFTSTPLDEDLSDDGGYTTHKYEVYDTEEAKRDKHKRIFQSKGKKLGVHKQHGHQKHHNSVVHKEKDAAHKRRINKIKHAIRTKTFYEIVKVREDNEKHDHSDHQNKNQRHKKGNRKSGRQHANNTTINIQKNSKN